ncbi:MAG: sigma 54-interacting transcriptional regulator [Candidatus Accumulibacter sp.]|jgi:Nif-specific regulatory protein|nr:sigma 54-interacting transcriptional regulator [Accumulibacter sp.]
MNAEMIAMNNEGADDTGFGVDEFAIERRARRVCERDLSECRAGLLPLLFELSSLVAVNDDLARILHTLLRILQRHMNVVRGMVSLFEPESGRIFIHESFGLSAEEAARGVYHLGEGVTGKVVESGQPIVVPRISKEPMFLHRATNRRAAGEFEHSFLCVPILRGNKVMGTVSAERLYDNRRLLELDAEILSILAATTAQAVELHLLKYMHKTALENENRRLHQALKARFKPSNIIGNSKAMQEVYALIERVTRSRTTVLILGESGVGKELVASAIHYNSADGKGPFVRFNCAALPESVIESELFGHERGAFTGAVAQRRGRFEEADGGTIFLDEIGELTLPTQAKLLRVLQEKSFERVGGNQTIQANIRILAATNRDLAAMVRQEKFREDLYYRLNVFPITIPPLRERGDDIVALADQLADHFVSHFSEEMNVDVHRISTPALSMLSSYAWPGNVRELENVIERAMVLADGGVIHGYHLPPSLQAPVIGEVTKAGQLEARMSAIEYEMIVEALKLHHGNISAAATQLGLTRRMLTLRMRRYKLDYKTFRR